MKNYVYSSVLDAEILSFLKVRSSQGFRDNNVYIMQSLDRYLVSRNVKEKRLTASIVDDWLSENSKTVCDNTLGHYVSYATQFAKFLNSLGYNAFIPEYRGRAKSYVPYIFSADEISAIFVAADNMNFGNERSRFQFPMLLRLLYGCGLRLGEAFRLRISDIDFDTKVLRILNAKGNRDRLVPMDSELSALLCEYCKVLYEGKQENPLVFEGEKGTPHHESWSQILFRKLLQAADIEIPALPRHSRNICVHCLRHTFAVTSLRKQDLAGIDSYDVSPLLSLYLGHSKLAQTQRYLHMTAENSMDILNATSEYTKGMFPEVPQ